MMGLLEELGRFTSGNLRVGEPLGKHTSFGIGGPCDYWVEPERGEEIFGIVSFLNKKGVRWGILGKGTNVLFEDSGFKGAIVSMKNFCSLSPNGESLRAGAGVLLEKLVSITTREGLSGLEFAAGIPGTVGGALIMNAGGRAGEFGDAVSSITLMSSETGLKTIARQNLRFDYRKCVLPKGAIAIDVTLKLERARIEDVKRKAGEVLNHRKLTQPLACRSAGCIFKNLGGIRAGMLIDEAGLKGMRVGGAEISSLHANFIINVDNAKASDVISLIRIIEEKVERNCGIKLEREIKVIED